MKKQSIENLVIIAVLMVAFYLPIYLSAQSQTNYTSNVVISSNLELEKITTEFEITDEYVDLYSNDKQLIHAAITRDELSEGNKRLILARLQDGAWFIFIIDEDYIRMGTKDGAEFIFILD